MSSSNTHCSFVSPGIDSAIGGEGEGVPGPETECLDFDVWCVEADPARQFCIDGGRLSQSSIVAESDRINGVILGDETEVVLAS